MEDHELLREYAERHSEGAFAELVGRHIDLVYSTALRVVGETHLAKDVAQMVFIGLARKPRSIRNPLALVGWLYRTTRFTAASALRTECRRRRSESAAMELNDLQSDSRSAWEALAPHLDAALDTLAPTDQDAVALRFFKGKSLREVGEALGTSEDAAQKRITRALEKLRSHFAHKGLATSSSLIASAMAAHAVAAAPTGLAASVAAGSLAGAAGGGATVLTLNLAGIMTATTLKISLAALVILAAVSTPILLRQRAAGPKPTATAALASPESSTPKEAPALAQNSPAANAPAPKLSPLDQLRMAVTNKLSAEQIEAYLQQNGRNAESLLAAFRVGQDNAYLREAAANFPNNPAVQFAAISHELFPDQQRQWLETLKTSAPDNALARYLSALDYFRNKQPDLAIQELTEATRKPSFDAYATQTTQAVEEMYTQAGRPALEAKYASTCLVLMTHLAQMKSLSGEMAQVQQQYRDAGDTDSANSLAYMGVVLGERLSAGANNLHLIDQLVGIAIEKKFIGQLDPAGNYALLGRPVSELQADIERQKQAIRESGQIVDQILPTLNETDLANYLDREKLYGESEAQAWLQTKFGQLQK
jgi:RNA polymerase sigma factor (sigma-70 family)